MKTPLDNDCYKILIELVNAKSYFWSKGKVYKSKIARRVAGHITCDLEDGVLSIPDFSHCKIVRLTSTL